MGLYFVLRAAFLFMEAFVENRLLPGTETQGACAYRYVMETGALFAAGKGF